MRDEVKIAVHDRMSQPNFGWTRGVLKNGEGRMCGNGVVCALAIEAGVEGVLWDGDEIREGTGYRRFGSSVNPGPKVLAWAGMTPLEARTIISFNDYEAISALDVADFIKNLPAQD